MFEREAKREKILEARNREIRLKAKVRSSAHLIEDDAEKAGGEIKEGEEEAEKDPYKDEYVNAAEEDFYKIINKELQKDMPIPEEEPKVEEPPPPEPEPEPLPPPPPPPPEKKKKGKGKKGKKGK